MQRGLAPRNQTYLTARSCHLRVALGDAAFEAPTPAAARSARPTIALATSEAEPDPPVASAVTIPAAGQATADDRPARCRIESGRSWRCWPAARATPDRRAAVPVGQHGEIASGADPGQDRHPPPRGTGPLPHPGRHRPSRALRLTAWPPLADVTSRRLMGRSAHTWRARWGRAAPAVRLWAGSRWVYRSASRRDREGNPVSLTAIVRVPVVACLGIGMVASASHRFISAASGRQAGTSRARVPPRRPWRRSLWPSRPAARPRPPARSATGPSPRRPSSTPSATSARAPPSRPASGPVWRARCCTPTPPRRSMRFRAAPPRRLKLRRPSPMLLAARMVRPSPSCSSR